MESAGFKEANLFADSDVEYDFAGEAKRKHSVNEDSPTKIVALQNAEVKKIEKRATIGEEANIKNKSKENPLWSIEETLFFPFGMTSHYIVGVNKSVLLMWSDLSVINFVIKKNLKTKQTKTTKVRISVPNGEQIKDIKVLEFNTLLLLESGRMNYFSSSKSMHTLQWLDNVRCITVSPNGFTIIRLTTDQKLVLEVYDDVVDMGKNTEGPLRHKYDITFDEQNLFNCGWEDEHYFLFSTAINDSNFKFLQLVARNALNLERQKDLHLFAISGNVFLLVPDIDSVSYHIEMLFSYSSNVAVIKLDFERNFCFIFLQCGMIDVWYMSQKWQRLRHQTYTIGAEHISFSYSESRAALYFTDGDQVGEFRFSISKECDELILHETYKAIPGILACTWIEAIEQLVCLDCNNIFHQLSFDMTRQTTEVRQAIDNKKPVIKTAEFEKFNMLFELTPHRVSKLLEKAHIIEQLNELPKTLHHDIELQFRKQEILAVSGKRHYYKTLLKARLEFSCRALSYFHNDVIPFYTQNNFVLSQRSCLALIYVEIENNEIFEKTFWQLHLQFESFNHIFTLDKSLLRKRLCLVVPLEMAADKVLPEFKLHLYTFVSCTRSYVAVALPISVAIDKETFAQLYTFNKISYTKSLFSQHKLEDILERFNQQTKSCDISETKCCLSVPKEFKLKSIFQISEEASLFFGDNILELYCIGSKLTIHHDPAKNILTLKSDEPATLFYIKMHLQLSFDQQSSISDAIDHESESQKVLRFQCNAERLYGTLPDIDAEEFNEKSQAVQKLKLLKELYLKMRRELFQPLFS